jgi:hypothetical protein
MARARQRVHASHRPFKKAHSQRRAGCDLFRLWRVHWPDGAISDMTNLSRAKDAATRFAETAERRKRIPAEVHRSPVVRSNEQTDLRYGQRR